MVHVCLNCLAIDKFSVCVNKENLKLKLNEMIIYPIYNMHLSNVLYRKSEKQ